MSLETQIGSLVEAANNLTGTVAGKVQEIDQKVDEATTAVAARIRQEMDATIYVDAVDGDDSSDGFSSSSPKKTIRSAILSTPPNSSVFLRLVKGVHDLGDREIALQGRQVRVRTERSDWRDPETFADIEQGWRVNSSGHYLSGRFRLGLGGVVMFERVRLKTAAFPSSEIETSSELVRQDASMVSPQDGFGRLIIKDSAVEIHNFAVCHQHESGGAGTVDLLLINTPIDMIDLSEFPGSKLNQYLVGSYSRSDSSFVPFSLVATSNVSHNAESWADLIDTNTQLMTTNLDLEA